MTATMLDWTTGSDGISYQRCETCGHAQYFRRDFCASCGKQTLKDEQASGRGIVHAVSVVHRAPSEALRAFAPYSIALIDTPEGFRLMAHIRAGIQIGDQVSAQFIDFGEQRVPIFVKSAP